MSIARLNNRITQIAVGRHLSHRTVRRRLTLLYSALFLLSGAALMAITYALLVNAGFVFTLQNGATTGPLIVRPAASTTGLPGGLPVPGTKTHPSAATIAHWQNVAVCMRAHGVAGFPNPTSSFPRGGPDPGVVSDRDGAIMVIPHTINPGSAAFARVATRCGFIDDNLSVQDRSRRTQTRQSLLIESGIALAGMSLLSILLGWFVAGRVLAPLEDSYKAQRQFVANASHELRAPLTRQRALIEVALGSPEASVDSLRRAHERVLASEQHLEQLIDALLALTRSQAGLERRQWLDLAAQAARVLEAQRPEIERLHLDARATLEPASTSGDPRLTERLIANLIGNAVHHNVAGGRVEITTGTRDRHAFVSIANSGPTVPSDEIPRLLEPFQRLGDARARHNNGHGLGLSIVQAIAKAHGAELSARPRPDGGLTVEVSFPSPRVPARRGGSDGGNGRPDLGVDPDFERQQRLDDLRVIEREHLSHDQTADVGRPVDPVVSVEDPGPVTGAGAAHPGDVDLDEVEPKAPPLWHGERRHVV
jgi:signal transduction histidine kinase